jgi:hypothetical protein
MGGDIPSRSWIKCLTPYVDSEGLVRVGGRLENAPFDYDCRPPIVLQADQRFTHLVIWDYYVRNFHVKTEQLLYDLRSKLLDYIRTTYRAISAEQMHPLQTTRHST